MRFDDKNEMTTDYTDRCGNCHEHLNKKDKYCRNCGTRRGEGKFMPFRNEVYCVYGPPIKKKYRCSSCNSMWITCDFGGMDSSDYCPQCGKKQTVLLDEVILGFGDYIGTEEPYDPEHHPMLFTEEQLVKLLRKRNGYDRFSEKELLRKMTEAGIDIHTQPETGRESRYYRTETEAEQMNLAAKILASIGNDLHAYPGVACRACGSKYVAALTNKKNSNHRLSENTMLAETKSLNPIVIYTNHALRTGESQSAFLCLQCGKKFVL